MEKRDSLFKKAAAFVSFFGIFYSLSTSAAVTIHGAGATFPFPLYDRWISEFSKSDASVVINYQSIGSGGGIRQFLSKTVDFGATDAPMTDEQLKKASPAAIHLPMTLGAVVVTYNLPEITQALKLDGKVLSEIFLGTVKTWNDPKIAQLNPGVQLPAKPILVVHRSDGSGTTAVFSEYLSKVSPDWKTKVGTGPSLNWPTGLGGKGNEGVSGLIKQSVGSIAYTELVYAKQIKMPVALIKNKAGKFVEPTVQSVTAAAAASKNIPADLRVSITDADGPASYPMSSFSYILVYSESAGEKAKAVSKFLEWALTQGQLKSQDLHYAPLPKAIAEKAIKVLKGIKII